MTSNEPKVSGLSPMTGPPGTKITVRGENLGQSSNDIIRLTINGADCLPYLEWVSSKKIITRCTRAIGSGDIVITTNSGGVGTCDVQFNCYEETVGPTDESAVWIDEVVNQTIENEQEITTMSSLDKYSAEISSNRFDPRQYLLQDHANADLNELEQLRERLQIDLAISNDTETTTSSSELVQLKSNLPVIMEFLSLLENLSKMIITSKDTSVDNIIGSIEQSRIDTKVLFDDLLKQKDLCQEIEGAMHVFRQNENLFNLPSLIENSIKQKNYDSVVKEISGVIPRLQTINIDQRMAKKIQIDITTKVEELKATIEEQLHQTCRNTTGERSIDEVKKLIIHLNRLNSPIHYDVWIALKEMAFSLSNTLVTKYEYYLNLSIEEANKLESANSVKNKVIEPTSPNKEKLDAPHVVQFVECAINIFQNTFYDILALGQSYFDPKDEFACKESEGVKQSRFTEFVEVMITKSITHLCTLLRYALVPDSSKLDEPSKWPSNQTETYVNWLRHVLRSIITCHIHLTKVNLPIASKTKNALEDFKEFVFELRERSMQILFENATRFNKNLYHQEDWVVEVDDTYGGTTKLPLIFEKNVVDTLRIANEVIFKTSLPDEQSILKRVNVQASMKELASVLINSFIDSLDNALINAKEEPAELTRYLLASKDSNRVLSTYMNRLLTTMCNCHYTEEVIFVRLQDEFERLQGLKMDKVFDICRKKYRDYINKLSQKFCRIKCDELSKDFKNNEHKSLEDLQINLMKVNSQIYLISPQLVNNLMTSIVNTMQEKLTTVQRL